MFSFISDSTRAFSIIASDAKKFFCFSKWLLLLHTQLPRTRSYKHTHTEREARGSTQRVNERIIKNWFLCVYFWKRVPMFVVLPKGKVYKCKLSLFMISIDDAIETWRWDIIGGRMINRMINYAALEWARARKNETNYPNHLLILRVVCTLQYQ